MEFEENENSNTINSQNDEIFLIKDKYVQIFFEILINDLLLSINFELISEQEFLYSYKSYTNII